MWGKFIGKAAIQYNMLGAATLGRRFTRFATGAHIFV